jgi:hypothetical protein
MSRPALTVFLLYISLCLKAQPFSEKHRVFEKADSISAIYKNHSIENLKLLSDKLTKNLQDETEKFRVIYRWVCDNISNDYTLYTQNKRKREKLNNKPEKLRTWNRKLTERVTSKLIEDHSTVCTGYAYLVKELAYHAGIECRIIDGYGRTAHSNIGGPGYANHSWNAVKLDDKWFLCDPTWSSGEIDPAEGEFIKNFNPYYFLADPELFLRNHYPLDTSWLLVNNKPTLREFLDRPLIYKGAFFQYIVPENPETFSATITKGEELTFHFKRLDGIQIENLRMQILDGSESVSVLLQVDRSSNNLFKLNYTFKNRGTYVVHFYINDDIICTYEIKVTK